MAKVGIKSWLRKIPLLGKIPALGYAILIDAMDFFTIPITTALATIPIVGQIFSILIGVGFTLLQGVLALAIFDNSMMLLGSLEIFLEVPKLAPLIGGLASTLKVVPSYTIVWYLIEKNKI